MKKMMFKAAIPILTGLLLVAPALAQSTGPSHAGYDPNAPLDGHYHDGLWVQHQKQDRGSSNSQAEAEGADHDGADEQRDGRDNDMDGFRQGFSRRRCRDVAAQHRWGALRQREAGRRASPAAVW